jgi:DNA-binding IclR family transcriptional regulator
MHDSRALISRYLRDYPGSKPAAIAEALSMPPANVRQSCKRMADAGQLRAEPGGTYYPPSTGDNRDTTELSQLSLRHSSPLTCADSSDTPVTAQ